MGKLDGKVAFITGAGRGQGRSHAVRLAAEGANVVGVDICADMDTVSYPLSDDDDLAETKALVESAGGKAIMRTADVRDLPRLQLVFDEATTELGGIDIVVANAGIAPMGTSEPDAAATFRDVVEVNLVGVWTTLQVSTPKLVAQARGGSIVITSSTAGLRGLGGGSAAGQAYAASKHGVVGLMRSAAVRLAPHNIRVNTIHPTGVNTTMVNNDGMARFLEEAAGSDGAMSNLLPVELLEPSDVSDALVWLVSAEARYVTGVTLPIDAGFCAK